MSNFVNRLKDLISGGFFHIFSSNLINKIIGFVSNILIVRFVSKFDFGIYSYALNVLSVALIFSGLGTISGTFQLYVENRDNYNLKLAIFKYGRKIGYIANLFISISMCVYAFVGKLSFEESRVILLLLSIQPIVRLIFEFQQIYLRGEFKNREYSILNTTNSSIVMLCSLLGAYFEGTKGLAIGVSIAYILTILIGKKKYVKYENTLIQLDYQWKKDLLKLSIVTMLENGISQLLYLLDIFILSEVTNNAELIASYKVATVIPTALNFIPAAVVTYIYPHFASNKKDKIWCYDNYKKLLKYMGIFNIFVCAVMIIFSKFIVETFYGIQYKDAIVCFKILVVGYFFQGTFRIIVSNLLYTQREVLFNLWIAIFMGILNIVGNIILIPRYESIGAAISTVIVVIVSSVIINVRYIYIVKRKRRVT